MDKYKELSFWIIFWKTLKSFFTRYDKHGSLWFRIRPLLPFGLISGLIIIVPNAYDEYIGFSINYPNREATFISTGHMFPTEINRQSYYTFISSTNEKIVFESNQLFGNTRNIFFDKNNGERSKVFVQVRWFMLPSGKGWIVDLWTDGKQYINETLSKEEFMRFKQSHVLLTTTLVILGLLILCVVSEYRYVKNKSTE